MLFTDESEAALVQATSVACDMRHSQVQATHILCGLVQTDLWAGSAGAAIFQMLMIQPHHDIESRLCDCLPREGKRQVHRDAISNGTEARRLLEVAERAAIQYGHVRISTAHLLYGFTAMKNHPAMDAFERAGVIREELLGVTLNYLRTAPHSCLR